MVVSRAKMFLDLYRQLTGTVGDYRVNCVNNGLILNIGVNATTNYAFIVGREKMENC